jgi:hypothetical protein
MFVAILPVAAKLIDRGSVTTVAVVSPTGPVRQTRDVLTSMLNSSGSEFDLIAASDEQTDRPGRRRASSTAVVATRSPDGQLGFSFHLGETMGQQQIGTLSLGVFGVAVLDYAAHNPVSGFQQPTIEVFRSVGGVDGERPFDASAFASRLIVGAVFGFLIFITIVIYGMWVAQGVVAEKASRVMELLVSAASTRQLVIGKALGIGWRGDPRSSSSRRPRARRGGDDRQPRARPGRRLRVVCVVVVAGPVARVRHVLRAGLRAVLPRVRGRGLAGEPARGPPDHRPAPEHRGDRRLRDGAACADRRYHRVHPARVTSRSGARS